MLAFFISWPLIRLAVTRLCKWCSFMQDWQWISFWRLMVTVLRLRAMRGWSVAAACAFAWAAGATSVAPQGMWVEGVARSSCAPYDGSAFEVRIPIRQRASLIVIRVNERLGVTGSRNVGSLSRPGGAAVSVCPTKSGQVDGLDATTVELDWQRCVASSGGVVRIDNASSEAMLGWMSANFPGGELMRGALSAKVVESSVPRACG